MFKSLAVLLFVAIAVVAAPALAGAGTITFGIANETAPINGATGGTGSFDVVVYENGGGDALYSFQFDLFVQAGASSIYFVGHDQPGSPAPSGYSNIEDTVAPYVFAASSSELGNADVYVYSPGPNGIEVVNSDVWNTNSPGPALSGTPLAMAHVVFTVPASTPAGSYALTFNQDNPATDPFADWVNTTSISVVAVFSPGAAVNGAIIVTPEPGSVVLLLMGAVGLCLARRRHKA